MVRRDSGRPVVAGTVDGRRRRHEKSDGNAISEAGDKVKSKKIAAASCAAVWAVYWHLFHPGLVTWDFYVQWHEMQGTRAFSDYHPLFYTLVIWLLTRVWYSPMAVVLAQGLSMAVVVGFSAAILRRAGVGRPVVCAAIAFYAVFPLYGFYTVCLWKDVAYAVALFGLTLAVFTAVATGGRSVRSGKWAAAFILSTLCVALFRHNGVVPAFGTSAALRAVYCRKHLKPLALSVATVGALFFFVRVPLFAVLEVDLSDKNVIKACLPVQHIGAVLADGGEVRSAERDFLDRIIPVPVWKARFDARSCLPLICGVDAKGVRYCDQALVEKDENYRKLLGAWLGIAARNPASIVKYHIRASELVWRITSAYGVFVVPDGELTAAHLYEGYRPSRKPAARAGATGRTLLRLIQDTGKGWLLHRGALYLWLTLFSASLFLVHTKKREWMLSLTPVLTQALTVVAFPLAQDTRYMFPIILTAPFLVTYFAFSRPCGSTGNGDRQRVVPQW